MHTTGTPYTSITSLSCLQNMNVRMLFSTFCLIHFYIYPQRPRPLPPSRHPDRLLQRKRQQRPPRGPERHLHLRRRRQSGHQAELRVERGWAEAGGGGRADLDPGER